MRVRRVAAFARPRDRRVRHCRIDSEHGGLSVDPTSRHTNLLMDLPGTFHFYSVTAKPADRTVLSAHTSGISIRMYIFVEPELRVLNEPLPLDAIVLQTVISKCLGPIDEWDSRLRLARECGYNFVHFTPLQQLGESHSAYSIADQHALNPALIPLDRAEAKWARLRDAIGALEAGGILSMSDVVWNHTAPESPWLAQHPECGYNLLNSAHLRAAFVLDRALLQLSRDLAAGVHAERYGIRDVHSDADLDRLGACIREAVLPALRLEEIVCIDIGRSVALLRDALQRRRGQPLAAGADGGRPVADVPPLSFTYDKDRLRKSMVADTLSVLLRLLPHPPDMPYDDYITLCCDRLRCVFCAPHGRGRRAGARPTPRLRSRR